MTDLEKLLEDDDTEIECSSVASNKIEAEFNNYISVPKVGLNENTLTWWKFNKHNFPTIKIFTKKYLVIQGSNVPSE